jgi:hypothetical protein
LVSIFSYIGYSFFGFFHANDDEGTPAVVAEGEVSVSTTPSDEEPNAPVGEEPTTRADEEARESPAMVLLHVIQEAGNVEEYIVDESGNLIKSITDTYGNLVEEISLGPVQGEPQVREYRRIAGDKVYEVTLQRKPPVIGFLRITVTVPAEKPSRRSR